ncbi:MAG: flagellar hook-length control protein FliK [Rheinheimera sp.]|nr:flagellar hook-length control protein FliK [Rheinheimera sp.]
MTDHSKAGDTAAPAAAAGKPASPTGTNSEHAIPAAIALKPAPQQQLVPLLARQTWPEQLGTDMKHWLSHARVAAPAANAQSWLWQLKHPGQQQLQLELTPQIEPRQLKLSVSDISRPFSFLPASTAIPAATTLKSDSRELWRQWLPLSQANPDLLADSPLLSAPVRQVLQELRTQHPDAAKLLTQQQLMQQINAALQFSPLQTPAQPNSAAGGLAIAIQLLLGRLGAQLPTERQNLPQKEKLQQLVGQLDRSQSAQLLRQLSGHSSQLQSAQIANVEQQANPATPQKPEQQLLIQLPLLQQGESRFTELAISEREADGSDNRSQQRCWQLTMKFDLGQQGEMLVQVRLTGKEVSLQFYADNEKTVQDTGQFLPLFKDRLTMQGLQVAEAGCQLGKIPEHLYQRGTSLLQVRV